MTDSPSTSAAEADSLRRNPALKQKLREFLRTDNHTNFLWIGRAWFIIALAFGASIGFDLWRAEAGLNWWWNLAVWLPAMLAIGASQHQLAGASHEAVHHTLFRNRRLNEFVSDWLCSFPLFTTTYHFRLYHLAHHQFVNDPERDPDFAMLARSGHWLRFPVSKLRFIGSMLRQFTILPLLRHIIVRGRMNSVGMHQESPYRHSRANSKMPGRLGVAFLVALIGTCLLIRHFGTPALLVTVVPGLWGAFALAFALLPERFYVMARIRPVLSLRAIYLCRTAFLTALFVSLLYLQMTTGVMFMRYFTILYMIPLLTVFPFCLVIRQIVQHGNGDRGWLTNTRIFYMNPVVRYAVFPFGMDYHLPHHMYATVPHYRLPDLHRFLQTFPAYADTAVEVENYLMPSRSHRHPTVVEVLGPEYAMGESSEVFEDHSVLQGWEVEEQDQIFARGEATPGPGRAAPPQVVHAEPAPPESTRSTAGMKTAPNPG